MALDVMLMAVASAIVVWVLFRIGLLSTAVAALFFTLFHASSMTMHASAWYAGIGYSVLFLLGVITLYGFRTALGGRPMMGSAGIED